ncbi:MAG: hypothetical protein HGA81_08525 [Chlorobium limicola]|uniref:hypothetical protein n=1 Tax=Chlorobium limicola TaxID=1092 RepID=UPI0002F06405|nr:hypothetical protein [Chlorobium limicola]NTV08633.1 hypothetical protein [Chlorobium limicola]
MLPQHALAVPLSGFAFEHINRRHAASPLENRMAKTPHSFIFRLFGLISATDR